MYVVDSDVCIDALRGARGAAEALAELESTGLLAVSAVTAHELWEGAVGARDPERALAAVDAFLHAFDVLPYDAAVAKIGGRIAGDLASAGVSIGDLDTMIAATAIASASPLVTRNVRHFKRVKGLTLHGL